MLAPLSTLTLAQTLGQTTLPWGGEAVLVAGLVAGVVLWLLGSKVLKPVFAVLGMALGGFAGVVLLPLTGLPSLELGGVAIGPGIIGLAIGAILGGLAAAGLFRVIMVISGGLVFAVAGTLGGLVYLQHAPLPEGDAGPVASTLEDAGEAASGTMDDLRAQTDATRDQVAGALHDLAEGVAGDEAHRRADEAADSLLSEETKAQLKDAGERSKAFIGEVRDTAKQAWDKRTPRERMVVLGSCVAGLLFGLIAGVIFPTRMTALVTALLGGAVWMFCGTTIARTMTGFEPAWSAQTWTVLWVGTAVIGLVLQLGVIGKHHHHHHHDDDDDDDDD